MNKKSRFLLSSAVLSICALLSAGVMAADAGAAGDGASEFSEARSNTHRVPLYKSTVVSVGGAIKQVAVGNPGVADVLVLRRSQLYIVAKAPGSTNITAWDANGALIAGFDVEVTHDLDLLKSKLHQLLPGDKVSVYSAQEKIVLTGEVGSTARADAAVQLAESFLPECIVAESSAADSKLKSGGGGSACKKGAIINLLQVGGAQQVMLKVTVAELARSVVKRLDANLNILNFGQRLSGGAVNGGSAFPDAIDANGLVTPIGVRPNLVGPAIDMMTPSTPSIDGPGAFLSYLDGDFFLQAVLDVSRRNGTAKILSEPTLTTLTGREAQFLSGGEFPIPVPQGGADGGSTTIEFKEFGVGLRFTPLVLDSGRINMTLNVSVSDLNADNGIVLRASGASNVFSIPSLSKRSASGTVELADGQTMGIAGLINDNMRDFVTKFPGLGDLPVIGALFRSQEFVTGRSELVIFVTPHLAKPIARADVRLPTDGFVEPKDYEFYLLGRTESGHKGPARSGRLQHLDIGHDVQP